MRAPIIRKVVIGVSGDWTRARLIVATHAMDREGRPRSDILAFCAARIRQWEHTPRTTRSSWHVRWGYPPRYRRHRSVDAATIGHPYSVGEKVYDVTFENVQAG